MLDDLPELFRCGTTKRMNGQVKAHENEHNTDIPAEKNRKGYVSCLDLEKKILIVVEFLTQ